MAYNITVDEDKCVGCGQCVDICPASVYELKGDKTDPVNMDECLGCESCVSVCPNDAIVVEEA
ncbi:MAG: 4Fe-4S binding protein [Mailhella sp.]|nr:4Fe-4S binding protein [Mailhella sp.]